MRSFRLVFFVLCIGVFGNESVSSQPPRLEWAKGQGTPLSEHVIEGVQSRDGGFCLVGKTDEPAGKWADALVIKINSEGELEWQQRIGNRRSQEEARCIIEVADGYLIGGTFSHRGKKSQAGICKLDRSGKRLWTRILPHPRFGAVRGLAADRDGHWVGTGYTDFDSPEVPFIAEEARGLLFKADRDGVVIWQRQLPVAQGSKVELNAKTGVIAVCGTEWRTSDNVPAADEDEEEDDEGEGEHQDGFLLLLDGKGKQRGLHFYGGATQDQLFDIESVKDGWVLAGHSTSGGSGWDAWLVRVDEKGTKRWQTRFGQPLGGNEDFIYDECYGVKQTGDEGFLLACGSGIEPDNVQDDNDKRNIWAAYLIKVDGSGNLQWEYTYHRPDSGHNACEWVIPVREGGYLMLLDSDHLGDAEEENVGLLKLAEPVDDP